MKILICIFRRNFLVGLIETANINLRELDFNVFSSGLIKAILNYVPEFTLCQLGFGKEYKSYEELKNANLFKIEGSEE